MKLHTLFVLLAISSGSLSAQTVEVKEAWARASVAGQKASAAFMRITARENTRLVSVSSPVAGVAELHQMQMDGDIMKMRAVQGGLVLPAGKAVALTPGGYHVMLMDLKSALRKDSTIPLTLVFEDSKGARSTLELKVPVSAVAPVGPAHGAAAHKH